MTVTVSLASKSPQAPLAHTGTCHRIPLIFVLCCFAISDASYISPTGSTDSDTTYLLRFPEANATLDLGCLSIPGSSHHGNTN